MPSGLSRTATDGLKTKPETTIEVASHLSLWLQLERETVRGAEPSEDPIHKFRRPARISPKSAKPAPGISVFTMKFESIKGLAIKRTLSESQFFRRTHRGKAGFRRDSRFSKTILCFQLSGAIVGLHHDS